MSGTIVNIGFGSLALGASLWELHHPDAPTSEYAIFAAIFGFVAVGLKAEHPVASVLYGSAAFLQIWMWKAAFDRRPGVKS